MLLSILVLLIVGFILGIGLFVIARNKNSKMNIAFSSFAILVALWISANYMGANFKEYSWAILFIRADLFLGPILALTFWWFSTELSLTARLSRPPKLGVIVIGGAVLASLFSLTDLVASVTYIEGTEAKITYGSLYVVYSVILFLITFIGYLSLFLAYRKSRGLLRTQIAIMLLGLGTAVVFVLVPNLVLPQITDSESINLFIGNIAYLGLAFFVFTTFYTIVKHKLFDVRLVVARSVGYILSISALGAFFGLVSFAFINKLIFSTNSITIQQEIIYTVLAVMIAFAFQPLKSFFDRQTNRLFYRDAYDSQELLDHLNKVIVSTIDLHKLLDSVSDVISTTLKIDFCVFVINSTEGTRERIIGITQKSVDKSSISKALAIVSGIKYRTIVTDELEADQSKLKSALRKGDIAVLLGLSDTPTNQTNGIGYIVLGQKRSGSPYSRKDIKVLEIIANSMLIAIDNALRFEEIQNFNKTLEQKVDDATRKLQRANDKLVTLDQTKDDFISMASHQLRTPLTSVKGYLSMVLEGDAGKVNKDQKELLGQAFVSSQRMVYLISDLLNVSRLRTGKFVIDASPIDLADIVESEVAQLRETASARGLKLIYKKPKDFPVVMLDETKIRQVMTNFLDNAIYYTPNNGKIHIELRDNRDTIELLVEDSGIGVPKQEQHHLFTKFFRAGNAKKARPDGTGLGLFMAKKVIIAQGGAVIFRSTEGKGSTFGFTFQKNRLKPSK